MRNIESNTFKVTKNIELASVATTFDTNASEKEVNKELKAIRKKLGDFQNTLYAHNKYAVLLCFQGMDTSGKDSLIREVFKSFNVRGVQVHSFKTPTSKELSHDYLWRHYVALPARGKFGIFNRTHYENVLVTRVHPEYILNENLPSINSVDDIDQDFWEQRFKQINNFENHIADNGTIICKFYLHLSKEEQKKRLLRRLEKKDKNWKFDKGDLAERKLWKDYQACYEDAINKTSKKKAPWYIIPADDKGTARLIVAKILFDTLMTYSEIKEPELNAQQTSDLKEYIQHLENEE